MSTQDRPPRRRQPPPSLSHSLYGLENAVPPHTYSPGQSSLTPYGTPSPNASPLTSPLNKPLPEHPDMPVYHPSRASSVYSGDSAKSGDSGYTKIFQSYGERDDEPPPLPVILQPKAYRDTVAPLLAKRFSSAPTPDSIPALPHVPEQSVPFLRLTADKSPPPSVGSKHAPTFAEFSRNIRRDRRNDLVSPMSSQLSPDFNRLSFGQVSSPEPSPMFPSSSFKAQEYAQITDAGSDQCTDEIKSELVPRPLNLSRSSKSQSISDTPPLRSQSEVREHHRQAQEAELTRLIASQSSFPPSSPLPRQSESERRPEQTKKVYRLSTDSFSSDSFTVYNGARETVRAMIKEKMQKKKISAAEKKKGSKDLKRVVSFAESENPAVELNASPRLFKRQGGDSGRYLSWVSSRSSSLQISVSNLIRKVSVRNRNAEEEERGRTMERGRSRRRQKQRAIPSTPYQRYGPDIWLAKNKRKRAARRAEATAAKISGQTPSSEIEETKTFIRTTLQREQKLWYDAESPNPTKGKTSEFTAALHNGSHQILSVFGGIGSKGRSASQRRRDRIKKSIVLVGPTTIGVGDADTLEDGGWV